MKVKAQIAMVLNLDKCIGCHTCSVTCKQVWTNRPGVEYAWFNNVESKPGIGYPKNWEDQQKWKGGWILGKKNKLTPVQGNRVTILSKIFANPHLPQIDDYYEPFSFDYNHLQNARKGSSSPTAKPYSLVTKKEMEKINWGPNWEDDLGGHSNDRSKDTNMNDVEKEIYSRFEQTFLMYLPRLCEHCLNPTCVASCPSGSIYKRDQDGIVLVDQDKCKGWRMCISGCPYKKIYFNWKTGKAEKCLFCYPRIESGEPTVCGETCVGRMRYIGVLLYDADKIETVASTVDEGDLYQAQLDIFLNPHDSKVIDEAKKEGIPESWITYAQRSPTYKLIIDYKLALPLHPEFRTLPMVWYIPPLSPILSEIPMDSLTSTDDIPDIKDLRIPIKYLANLLTAGDEKPVEHSLKKLIALRRWMRDKNVHKKENHHILEDMGLTVQIAEEMYHLLALAPYSDRFVIPSSYVSKEKSVEAFEKEIIKASCFSDCLGCGSATSVGPDFKFDLSKYRGNKNE